MLLAQYRPSAVGSKGSIPQASNGRVHFAHSIFSTVFLHHPGTDLILGRYSVGIDLSLLAHYWTSHSV